jgi:hypothetical protein
VKPPTRLLADDSIEPELREALQNEASREVAYDVSAGLARFESALAAGTPASSLAGWKLKLLLGGGGAGVAIAALVGYQLSRPEAEPVSAPAVVSPVVSAPLAPKPELAPPPPEKRAPAPEPSVTKARPQPAPSASAQSARERLAEEVRHLGELRRLAASNPSAAVRMADEGHVRFKSGMLYQEREAVAITSLAGAGRQSEAQTRAKRFLQVFPNSPFAEQVRGATGAEP